jgi:hypothetical protein
VPGDRNRQAAAATGQRLPARVTHAASVPHVAVRARPGRRVTPCVWLPAWLLLALPAMPAPAAAAADSPDQLTSPPDTQIVAAQAEAAPALVPRRAASAGTLPPPAAGDGFVRGDCDAVPRRLRQRPVQDGEPVTVHLSIGVMNLLAIDDTERTFTVDLLVGWRWTDPRLAAGQRDDWVVRCDLAPDDLWGPRPQYVNARSMSERAIEPLRVGRDGEVTMRSRVQATFNTPLALRNFPFDRQRLALQVVTPSPAGALRIEPQVVLRRGGEFSEIGWRVGNADAESSSFEVPQAGRQAVQATVSIDVARDPRFYLWRIVVPLVLIVAMSWSVFWIHSNQLGAQMEVSSASVLTLIAFQLSFADVLPRIPYLTRLDAFVLASTALVFLALAESVATSWLARRERVVLAERIDLASRWLFPLAFTCTLAALAAGAL